MTAQDSSKIEVGLEVFTTHVEEFRRAYADDPERAFRRFGFASLHSLPAAERLAILQSHGWLGKDATDLYNLATAALKSGNEDEAIDLYKKALKADPAHYEANRNLAILQHQKGDMKGARSHAQKALEAAPADDLDEIEDFLAELG